MVLLNPEIKMEYTCRLDLNQKDAHQVLKLYRQAWWASERTLASTISVLKGSTHSIGVFDSSGHLIGFGRALSDGIEKATLYDIIVDEQYKGQGFGKVIIDQLLLAPMCSRAQHVELYCKEEMVPFYAKWGFTDITSQVKLLRKKPLFTK